MYDTGGCEICKKAMVCNECEDQEALNVGVNVVLTVMWTDKRVWTCARH